MATRHLIWLRIHGFFFGIRVSDIRRSLFDPVDSRVAHPHSIQLLKTDKEVQYENIEFSLPARD